MRDTYSYLIGAMHLWSATGLVAYSDFIYAWYGSSYDRIVARTQMVSCTLCTECNRIDQIHSCHICFSCVQGTLITVEKQYMNHAYSTIVHSVSKLSCLIYGLPFICFQICH